jgi:hypothetical protein
MCAEETTESMDTLRSEVNVTETQAKAIAKAVGVALHQSVATHDDINDVKTIIGTVDTRVTLLETKMDAGFKNLETKLNAKLKIQQFWIYLLNAAIGGQVGINPSKAHEKG